MERKIRAIALVVKDYEEAIQFYTEKLNFRSIEDTRLDDKKRWGLIPFPLTINPKLLFF